MEKFKYLLSVIVPCYNGYHLMQRGLEQLRKQASEEVEVIIVDDCSVDQSYEKLLAYSEKSTFSIRVLQTVSNSGPGTARNIGIQHAQGMYITFMDADDYFDDQWFSLLYGPLHDGWDCIIYDANVVGRYQRQMNMVLCATNSASISTEEALVFTRGATCGKVYKRQLIIDYEIAFLNLKRNEDIPFTKCALGVCEKIYYLEKPLYYYVMHGASLMHDDTLIDPQNARTAFQYIQKKLSEKFPEEVEAIFIKECLYSTVLINADKMNKKSFRHYLEELEGDFPLCYKNKYLSRFPQYIKFVLRLIHARMYRMLKAVLWIKLHYAKR